MPLPPLTEAQWELAVEGEGRSGAANMAIDAALLAEADRAGRAFLRLYRWTPPALSLGRNETTLDRYDRTAIQRLGLDVVRRPTGGRAVWHEHEVTYAVAAPIGHFGSLRAAYGAIHERLAAALRSLGVAAHLAPDHASIRRSAGSSFSGPCFAASVGGEVLVGGRKVVGSAQVRRGAAFLQHGSILLDGSQDLVSAVSAAPKATGGATTLREALGRPVGFDEVTGAIRAAWGFELTSADSYRPLPSSIAFFSDPSWTWRR